MAGYWKFFLWSLTVTLNLDTKRNVLNEIWVTMSQLEKVACVAKDSFTFMANFLKLALRSFRPGSDAVLHMSRIECK